MSSGLKTESKKEVVQFEELFNGGRNLADVDLDKVDLVKGKTPDDIEEQCLEKCKEYLSGNWCHQTIETIEVRRITGGLLNQIYYCGLREPIKTGGVPQEVVIKFYGDFRPIEEEDKSKIRELVISLIFSEQGIGPQIYGVFEGGQIQKFYKQRAFSIEDRDNPVIYKKVFGALAKIHSLEVPIKKVVTHIDKSNPESIEMFNKLIEENNCETLLKYDVGTEINWLKGVMERVVSPVVFCHSDFRSSNLMITEPDNKLVVCDFDVSTYNYRGSDFSMLMKEWKNKHFLFNIGAIEGIPLREELRPYIEIYVEECIRIHGKSFTANPNNSVEHIIKEAKVFLLYSYIELVARMREPRPKPKEGEVDPMAQFNPNAIIRMAETNYKSYITVKGILEEQKLFD